MPLGFDRSKNISFNMLADGMTPDDFLDRLKPVSPQEKPLGKRIPFGNDFTDQGLKGRQDFLESQGVALKELKKNSSGISAEEIRGNIENQIGFGQIPIGLIGPLRINGINANGDFYVPMATTEGALIASYHRGSYVISTSGGASAICLNESVCRAPCFIFESLSEVGIFLSWIYQKFEQFKEVIGTRTRFGKLIDMKTTVNGTSVYLIFEYTTGDAAGQNMVTVATEAICEVILNETPIQPKTWYLEGNLSGDKKASMLSFLGTRGKKVVAEVTLKKRVIKRFLHTTAEDMAHYCKTSIMGGIQSGGIGVQGHFANALAAMFIACGQDAACISEASIGITDMEVTGDSNLHVSVSMPNLIVGTVGGGTHLPTARECLEIMDCFGAGKARKFAEICAVTAMAGEISIIAALAAGDFGKAHATYRHKA